MLSTVLFLKNLFLPRYEVRVCHPVDREALAHLSSKDHRLAVEDLSQDSAVSIRGLLCHVGVHGSKPIVIFSGDAVHTMVRVKLQNDLAAMELADALKAHLCEHSAVLVVPSGPEKNIEAVLQR